MVCERTLIIATGVICATSTWCFKMSASLSNAAPFPAWRVPHAAGAEQRALSVEQQQEQALEGAVVLLKSAAEAAASAACPGWHRLSRTPTNGELAARLHEVVAEKTSPGRTGGGGVVGGPSRRA